MMILFVISFMANYNLSNKKIRVVERTEAMLISKGYVVLKSDSVFKFQNKKYLIKTREFFDEDGELNHAVLWSEMGYEDWPKENMAKIKHFLDDYNFSHSIKALLIDSQHININSNTGLIRGIDEKRRIIYYNIDRDKEPNMIVYLHRIIYK